MWQRLCQQMLRVLGTILLFIVYLLLKYRSHQKEYYHTLTNKKWKRVNFKMFLLNIVRAIFSMTWNLKILILTTFHLTKNYLK